MYSLVEDDVQGSGGLDECLCEDREEERDSCRTKFLRVDGKLEPQVVWCSVLSPGVGKKNTSLRRRLLGSRELPGASAQISSCTQYKRKLS
jgi:hypothetical protein